ncbi:heavy metal response regulator transcription factor [Vibrio parahaemolyticus]|uniref:heavy metal response regulator transcription factor n=1 Tax=Vibrio parahaemolyticus TaxID=670 RepID=UPI0011246E77|nr:heavy metal response regulator transcription factor [Vibrio parahaemolyticus]MBE3728543.1 heavy metal response regulator transcription factor [Vibrio parahaemolyticus]MBE4172220.1 heavy metal response regulator transcription factor [Vibrio parahaemolyticus]MBM5011756.1 heavy metal response regulator transcription factor [Vibrio parahaemolyticus]MCR9709854.1 heavy metal response regulator transcription factor [Vibrio parahaemolyticus]MCR9758124.1 heavy metal response regulator transcription 
MKILIVEDEHKAGEYLQKGLIESGYVVDLVHDGVDGLYHSTSEEYDLILLDIMLPKLDGWQVLNTLRSSGIHTPVIMLTAKEQVEDRVRGFELGANDYVVKPYAFAELLARVQNVFRHHIAAQVVASPQTLRVADLELDMIKRVATRAGQSMSLTAKEYALLELLMRKTGQVLSRTTIASLVWDMNFDSDTNVIDVAVKRLRSKVDKPFDKPLIHTVRGMGYKLEESCDA